MNINNDDKDENNDDEMDKRENDYKETTSLLNTGNFSLFLLSFV